MQSIRLAGAKGIHIIMQTILAEAAREGKESKSESYEGVSEANEVERFYK